AVADLQVLYYPAELHHFTHKLMAEDVARFHRRNEAVINMQIRAADRRRRDPDNRVALVQYFWVGHISHLDRLQIHPSSGSHFYSFPPFTNDRSRYLIQ